MQSHPRIASLVPSATDIVAALGLADQLVGVSHECDHPAAKGKPVLTSSMLPNRGQGLTPAEIDSRVVNAAQRGEPLYRTDRQRLEALAPDVVIAQGICDVCAVGPEQVPLPAGAELVTLTAGRIGALYDDLRRVGAAAGAAQQALELGDAVRARLLAVREAIGERDRPKVLGLEWSEPPFLGGHWVPEMVVEAGGEHVLTRPGEPSRRSDWEEIGRGDPDVILFMPCGYALDEAHQEAQALRRLPEARALRAVAEGRLWATDATHLFSRCTPASIARGTEVIAAILHPDIFDAPTPHEAKQVMP